MAVATKYPSTSRIEAFSDGVFAILLTIMVLDLRPPGQTLDHDSLASLMTYLPPKLTIYALSFIVIARIWVSHHQLLFASRHSTMALLWSNVLLLFWMSLIPFATGYLAEDLDRPPAVATYATVMFLTASTFTWLRYYVVTHLRNEEQSVHIHPKLVQRSFVGMALYGLGIPFAYISVYVSYLLFIVVPIISFLNDSHPRRS